MKIKKQVQHHEVCATCDLYTAVTQTAGTTKINCKPLYSNTVWKSRKCGVYCSILKSATFMKSFNFGEIILCYLIIYYTYY